jgi:predicted methyltransferase
MRFLAAATVAILPALCAAADEDARPAIEAAVAAADRPAEHRARDAWRHPVETLTFFGVRRGMHVVELWPAGAGWYTEILAELLKDDGKLTVAVFGDQTDQYRDFQLRANEELAARFAANPELYGDVQVTELWAPVQVDIAQPGSADAVLTFRNLHNWMKWRQTDAVLAAVHRALKPGGILGVVDHRAAADAPLDQEANSGYVNEDWAIRTIESAGFELLDRSEVNANAKDSTRHPRGVWTLPPTLALGDKDRDRYEAIGESDRFTLRFRKR